MAEATKEKAAPAEAATEKELSTKEKIYVKIAEMVKAKTGKRIGKTGGRELFDTVVEEIFVSATTDGSFRFNAGFGSMHVRTYGAGERRLPSGKKTKFGTRRKLRYEEGVMVATLVEHNGDRTKLPTRAPAAAPAAALEAPVKAEEPTESVDLD